MVVIKYGIGYILAAFVLCWIWYRIKRNEREVRARELARIERNTE